MENVDFGQLFLRFDGRINRAKFWLGILIIWVVEGILGQLLEFTSPLYGVIALVLLWPSLAVAIKRWHDRGKSGWWVLIVLIPLIGFIWAIIETGFLVGTPGPNQYGADPLGSAAPEPA